MIKYSAHVLLAQLHGVVGRETIGNYLQEEYAALGTLAVNLGSDVER